MSNLQLTKDKLCFPYVVKDTNLEISDLEVMTDILKEELETAGRTLDTYPFVLSADQDIREDDSAFREWIQNQ